VVVASGSAEYPLDLNSFRAQAQTNCWCQGCGCKGGPGWRGPNRQCVSHRELS